jgi:hypothetical protein
LPQFFHCDKKKSQKPKKSQPYHGFCEKKWGKNKKTAKKNSHTEWPYIK